RVVGDQAGAHGEQLAQGGLALVGGELEGAGGLGDVGGDRVVQVQPPLVPQREERRGGERLRHRGDAGDGRAIHRPRPLGRGPAGELAVPGGAVAQHLLLVAVPADDRPGHAGGLVVGDRRVEQGGDRGERGGRDSGGGAA